MSALHIQTPMLTSRALGLRGGQTVLLKLEALQPPGSFKIRGIGLACQEYVGRGARRLISSSGGNAGIAVAYAGRRLGIPVVVAVPETTTERARTLIQNEGAELIVDGASWQEANARAQSMLTAADAFLHPFDDPLLWQGHSTMIDEVAAAGVTPDAIVLSDGGGGLLCGVMEGMHRHGWHDVPVVAVETVGADSFFQSVKAGRRIELQKITSIATSLGARQVCAQAFEWSMRHPTRAVLVSDRAAVSACMRFLLDHRIHVEPACGAALAAVYDNVPEIDGCRTILVIVCGGVTASVEQLLAWAAQLH
jgi:L-serine/L-threonine ammonia-lyase